MRPNNPAMFVGRQAEVALLTHALQAVTGGAGQLVFVVGEAGIGKTSIAQVFAEGACQQGTMVLWGRCFEGEWQPPYGPWVEALGEYTQTSTPERLQHLLGFRAPPLVRLVPEMHALLPNTPLAAALGSAEERFRLYDAVTHLLRLAAQEQPVVLVLDDLHWADRDSLALLRYVARGIRQMRLLIVGIYRDTDLDRQHPLADMLAIMRRESDYMRLPVSGLSMAEIAHYLTLAAGHALPQTLVEEFSAETNGNPFYLRELFHHLLEETRLIPRSGDWFVQIDLRALGVPEGVRQVINRRISRLSAATADMLRFAAGFARSFAFDVLQAVIGLPEDALLDCLDEALQAGLIHPIGGTPARYDFTHAIIRHALFEALNPDRQARLHRRIAVALEQRYRGCELAYAAELAAQYHASATLPGANKGVGYALAAAEQAQTAYAHEREVTFLRLAHDLAATSDATTRAALACKLAVAEARALLLSAAQHSAQRALVALTEADTAPEEIVAFLEVVARALKDGGASPLVWRPLVERGLALHGWVQQALTLRQQLTAHQSAVSVVPSAAPGSLTPREGEVLRLLAAGKTNKEIATVLRISIPTVERHVANLYAKIDARNHADATAYAWQHGLVQRPETH